MKVSVIIPCLNEEGSIEECIRLVKRAFSGSQDQTQLEVIVADNGSTDRSKALAEKLGVRVVEERRRGYGAAILCGMREASGDYIVIGDADNTYDFRDAVLLVEELQKGAEFAIGDRINGRPDVGAMPWLHQYLGTPALTWILNQFFGSRVHDINCGLRAVRRECISRLRLRSPGMEFASEMVIHAAKAGLKFAEVPIRYYRRHHGQAKLRTFRDGWRHLRFILLCAPFPVFVVPAAIGVAISFYFFQSDRLGVKLLGNITLLSALQVFIFGILAKSYLWVADSFMVDRAFGKLIEKFKLEYGILGSALMALAGVLYLNRLDIGNLIRASAFIALSVQIFFSSFLLSTIVYKKRDTI